MLLNRTLKKISALSLLVLLFLFNAGYSFPPDSPYLVVNCSIGNNVKLYMPEDSVKHFYVDVDNNVIVNTWASSVYAYTTSYRITFPTYSDPTYVPNGSYGSQTFVIRQILEDHRFDSERVNYDYHQNIMLFAGIGGILLCLFILLLK